MPCPPPDLGIKSTSLMSPAKAGEFFTTGAIWKLPIHNYSYKTCFLIATFTPLLIKHSWFCYFKQNSKENLYITWETDIYKIWVNTFDNLLSFRNHTHTYIPISEAWKYQDISTESVCSFSVLRQFSVWKLLHSFFIYFLKSLEIFILVFLLYISFLTFFLYELTVHILYISIYIINFILISKNFFY